MGPREPVAGGRTARNPAYTFAIRADSPAEMGIGNYETLNSMSHRGRRAIQGAIGRLKQNGQLATGEEVGGVYTELLHADVDSTLAHLCTSQKGETHINIPSLSAYWRLREVVRGAGLGA